MFMNKLYRLSEDISSDISINLNTRLNIAVMNLTNTIQFKNISKFRLRCITVMFIKVPDIDYGIFERHNWLRLNTSFTLPFPIK